MRPPVFFYLIVFGCSFIWVPKLPAQKDCFPPGILPATDCNSVPLYCLDGVWCETIINPPNTVHHEWCGPNTRIDNPQYYQFIAAESIVTFEIYVAQCDEGVGLQAGILEAICPWGNQDVIACEETIPLESSVLLSAAVVVGKTYWLMLDGASGALCTYNFSSQGIQNPPVDGALDPAQTSASPNIVCPGTSNVFFQTGPALDFASCYKWSFGWTSDTINSGNPGFFYDIAEDAPAGIWDVCVMAVFSTCDSSKTVCTQIEILDDSDKIKMPESFCPEDFPFSWYGIVVSGPGEYHTTYVNAQGCEYDSIWIVDQLNESEVGIIDTVVCSNSFTYEGQPYVESGTYFIEYPNQSILGCDSVAELHLIIGHVEFYIETKISDTNSVLVPQITEDIQDDNLFSYEWYNCDFGELLSTNREYKIDSPGCYCLIINSGFCQDTICSLFETTVQDSGCIEMPDLVCIGDSILLRYTGGDTSAILHWLVELPDGDTIFFSDTDTISITNDSSDCYHVSLTIVNDSSSITCRDSFCNDANPLEGYICCDDLLCDTCSYLIFNMNGLPPWTIIYSAGAVIDTLENVLENPYEHRVCLPDGVNIVNFTFIEFANEHEICSGQILGFNTVQHRRYVGPVPEIAVTDSVLCAPPGYLSYNWHDCANNDILSQDECYRPSATGCYCSDIHISPTCILTSCADFISDTDIINFDPGITVFPNPSSGRLYVHLNDQFTFPAKWVLFDQIGIQLRHGMFASDQAELFLADISKGLYLLEIQNKKGNSVTARIIIE